MARAVSWTFSGLAAQVRHDLSPFEGRAGMTWRIALLCAIVAMVAMVYKVPEPALSCYLIIFLMNPNGAECVGKGLGLIVLVSIIVLLLVPIVNVTIESQILRMLAIIGLSFVPVFFGAASALGEIGSIIALVLAFVLTLVDMVPVGEVATRGLLYAWQMASMPMALMVVFCLALGWSPQRLIRRRLAARLNAVADVLERPGPAGRARLGAWLSEGNDASFQLAQMSSQMGLTRREATRLLAARVESSYRLLLAAAALPESGEGWAGSPQARALASSCRAAAAAIRARTVPPAPPELAMGSRASDGQAGRALGLIGEALAEFAVPPPDAGAAPRKVPFLKPDAFSNPEYQRYALKVTAAAVVAYILYSSASWQGIHTAMITCYVAALGTTGETVHKLLLRISGALVGAAMGIASIIFIAPHLTAIDGLMVLVFLGVLPAAWVSSGPERISYAGVQIGLAFLLTVLNGFQPSTDLSVASDRVIGILVGNLVVYVVFTSVWPKSAVEDVRLRLASALSLLSGLAALAPEERRRAVNVAAQAGTELAAAEAGLEVLAFEPARLQPPLAEVRRLTEAARQARALGPSLFIAPERREDIAAALAAAGVALRQQGEAAVAGSGPAALPLGTIPPIEQGGGDELGTRATRIGLLLAG
ncbi:FUSC family protein [Ancylobacter sp. A5.8]|uniref:FUSC family protein n=1 Tax=Ancylobacter gelatini TaxID=2919920 RepID=UPI001F4DCF70|nr:FUSC family protein [Ancylobacter gelatini]MCJ8144480.1 FUSC family protein [Ancylobacter gelatini]